MGVFYRGFQLLTVIVLLVCMGHSQTDVQPATPQGGGSVLSQEEKTELLNKLDELVQGNQRLEEQVRQVTEENQQLLDEIRAIRQKLADESTNNVAQPSATQYSTEQESTKSGNGASHGSATTPQQEQKYWGTYTPNLGFKLANTEYGDLNVSIYTYARYLNQLGLDPTFTNAFGNTTTVTRRQDMQLLKLQVKFLGWVISPKFRYFLYGWTSNANQGQGAQVVLAGNLNYDLNKYFTFGAGIYSLPGTRSVEGNFPFWLGVDTRLIADEFFRPSYTSGLIIRGNLTDKLRYQTMLGNNLSTLGVSALQLDNGFNTFSSALVWTPTAEFGQGFGDFEDHQKLATRFAGHFNRSHETTQSQPGSETFENTQIRLADGSIIFTPNLFGPGITINEVRYRMAAADFGLKYHGFSLDGEYFWRWLDNFGGPGTAGLPLIYARGFQMQGSAMVVPKTLQLYAGGSTIRDKVANPFDFRVGLNWFPWKNKVVRWNNEGLYLYKSPVGYTSVPFSVGGRGWVFHSNLELAF
jgi:hypothetical protein